MPTTKSDKRERVWGGTTLDERRAVRRVAFADAALELIGEQGSSAVTVRSLCRRTGLTDRYFYESFASREELLRTIYQDVSTEAYRRMTDAIDGAGADPEQIARAALEAFVEMIVDDPRKGRLLTVEPLADSAYGDVTMSTAMSVTKLLGSKLPKKGVAGTKRAMAVIALTGSLAALLSSWLQGNLKVTRDELVEQATELVVQTFHATAGPAQVQRGIDKPSGTSTGSPG